MYQPQPIYDIEQQQIIMETPTTELYRNPFVDNLEEIIHYNTIGESQRKQIGGATSQRIREQEKKDKKEVQKKSDNFLPYKILKAIRKKN